MTDNVAQFSKEPVSHHPKLGELSERLTLLFDEYAGEIPTMAAIGILEAKKLAILQAGFEAHSSQWYNPTAQPN